MTDPLSPTPLSERDPVLKHIRTLSSGSLSKAEVNWLCDEIDRLAALNEAAADFIDGETTESETLAIIDRLSSGVAEPPAEDREGVEYDRGLTARRILNWAGKHDADGKLVGVAVGTDERNVTVDAATMVRLLNKADDERRRADYYEDEMTEFLFRDPGGGA